MNCSHSGCSKTCLRINYGINGDNFLVFNICNRHIIMFQTKKGMISNGYEGQGTNRIG